MTVDSVQWFRELALGTTYGLIFIYFALVLAFYYLYTKENKDNRLLLGVSLFFVFVAISRIFYIVFDYYLTEFIPTRYQSFIGIWKIATSFIIIGFGFIFFIADYNLLKGKDKYVLTIIYAVSGVITLSIPIFELSEIFSATVFISAMLFVPLTYLYLAIKTSEEIRRKSLTIFTGFIIYGLGIVLLAEFLIQYLLLVLPIPEEILRYLLHTISAIFKIVGSSVLLYGFS